MRRRLSKKAVSPVIGYILLITFVVIISVIVYQWVKTYIPREALECPDGVSIFVKDKETDCGANPKYLNFTLKNNGRFNISGYFIRASYDPEILATNSLWNYIEDLDSQVEGRVTFASDPSFQTNELGPGMEQEENFTFGSGGLTNTISFVEIIPVRYEDIDNRRRLSSCSDAKITEIICEGDLSCVAGTGCDEDGYACGALDDCNNYCPYADGQCNLNEYCASDNTCKADCGNNVIDSPELCDGTDVGATTCSDVGYSGAGTPGCSLSCDAYAIGTCDAPDLVISNLALSGDNKDITFKITNNGVETLQSVQWAVYELGNPIAIETGDEGIFTPGLVLDITTTGSFVNPGSTHIVKVDDPDNNLESDETNNEDQITR